MTQVPQEWVLDLPLLTQRLELRAHRDVDLDDLVVFHGDPRVTQYTPWPVRDREATREALAKRIGWTRADAAGGVISLAVVERASGTVIGEVVLARPATSSRAEIGYALRADRWGQGLASEAVARLLEAAAELGVQHVDAVVVRGNEASVRLLGRFGFVEVAHDEAGDRAAGHEDEGVDLQRFRLLLGRPAPASTVASAPDTRHHGPVTLLDRLDTDLHTAMKARDTFATGTLRQVIAAVRGAAKSGPVARDLDDDEILAVLTAEVKTRRESAEIYTGAGASDRATNETAEADFIEAYLPAALSDADLDALVSDAIAATGASSMKDMGTVMKAAQAAAAGRGRVDGKVLSGKVRAALSR